MLKFKKFELKNGFTLPEAATHVGTLKDNRKLAFTLAEVLITLGVIGVVAAITLPSFMENVTERVNSERQANIAQKITQAMEQMRAHGLLNTQYQSTESFVDELQKYLKIAKRCDSEHIADCWPTEKVTMSDGEELEVSKAKTGANLSLSTETNNVGLILSDGASIILNYNPASETIDVGDKVEAKGGVGIKSMPVGGGKSKDFVYTTGVTNSIDFVMDVNGSKKPNSEVNTSNRDIRSFKIASFSKGGPDCSVYHSSSFYVEDIGCVYKLDKNYTCARDYIGNNCWIGAQQACSALGMQIVNGTNVASLYRKKNEYPDIPQSGGYMIGVDNRNPVLYDFSSGTSFSGSDMNVQTKYNALCYK